MCLMLHFPYANNFTIPMMYIASTQTGKKKKKRKNREINWYAEREIDIKKGKNREINWYAEREIDIKKGEKQRNKLIRRKRNWQIHRQRIHRYANRNR